MRVTASFQNGHTATYLRTVVVRAAQSPHVSFPDASGETGQELSFHGYSDTGDGPTNSITGYTWNWDDGSPNGTGSDATHTYSAPGTHDVSLTVTYSETGPVTYRNAVHIYQAAGPPAVEFYGYAATLNGPPMQLTALGSFGDPAGPQPTFAWSFGDGATSTAKNPSHVYTQGGDFKITFTVTYPNGGGTATRSHWVSVEDKPAVAGFTWRSSSPITGTIVTFTGAGYDPDNAARTASSYAWDFGGGDTAAGQNPERTLAAGDHVVKLTVTFDDNSTAERTRTVHVSDAPANSDITSEHAAAGQTVASDSTAPTADNPVVTALKTSVAGAVTLVEQPIDEAEPSGYQFLSQQVNITAPDGTAAAPLELTFSVDSSQLPAGTTADNLMVFRNGVVLPNCSQPVGQTQSVLPCDIERSTNGEGDVVLKVLTVRASVWNVGIAEVAGTGGSSTPAATTDTSEPGPTSTPVTAGSPAVKALSLGITVVKAKLAAALAKGLAAKVKASGAGVVRVQLKLDARAAKKLKLTPVVATGKATFAKAGSKVILAKFTAKAKKALKKAKTIKLTLLVTSGKTTTTKAVTLTR